MPVPATTGVLRTNIADMEIGDYIVAKISNGKYSIGGDTTGLSEIPVTGKTTALSSDFWYVIKVDRGLLISDRVVRVSISWDALNIQKQIQGENATIDTTNELYALGGRIRSLTGGVAYADANGNKHSDAAARQYGGWPTNNEFTTYMMDSDLNGTVTPDDDNVWHHKTVWSWTQDTMSIISGGYRTFVGGTTVGPERIGSATANSAGTTSIGFRPVFEYSEAMS